MSKFCPMCNAVTNCTDNCKSCMEEEQLKNDSPKIIISKSAHGTADVVVYNLPCYHRTIRMVDFFVFLDIWGSRGYDRFNDDGLYFEVPAFVYDIIEDIPFIKTNHIEIIKR